MSIEFRCPSCDQQLRVPDSAAGKQARCPNCSHVARVPVQPESLHEEAPHELPPSSDIPVNPYASPAPEFAETQALPMVSDRIVNRPIDVGTVMQHAWQVWKANLGLLVGVFITLAVVNIGVSIPASIASAILERNEQVALAMAANLTGQIASNLVSIFLGIGNVIICLKLARGQNAEFSDLFSGGPRFLPVLAVSILFGLAASVGFVMCIVPGIILVLMWWPAYYVSVDAKADVIESFSVAKTITENNWGTTILLWLVSGGISILGVLALCVGIIFAAPLISMLWATAYLMMSGQLSTRT